MRYITTTISKCIYFLLLLFFSLSISITRAFASVYSHKIERWWYPPSHIPPTRSIYDYICLSNTRKKYTSKEQERRRGEGRWSCFVLFVGFSSPSYEQIQLDRSITTMIIIIINRFTTETTFGRFFHSSSFDSYTVKKRSNIITDDVISSWNIVERRKNDRGEEE
jgi:hypothetical protein